MKLTSNDQNFPVRYANANPFQNRTGTKFYQQNSPHQPRTTTSFYPTSAVTREQRRNMDFRCDVSHKKLYTILFIVINTSTMSHVSRWRKHFLIVMEKIPLISKMNENWCFRRKILSNIKSHFTFHASSEYFIDFYDDNYHSGRHLAMVDTSSQRVSFTKQVLSRSQIVFVAFLVILALFPHATLSFTFPTTPNGSPMYTTLYMGKKSSDRAHIERNLEDMMGNDWREFRAKLVAQEQAAVSLRQQQEKNMMMMVQTSTSLQPQRRPMATDPELYYHAHDVITHQQNDRPYSSLQQQHQVSSSFMTDMPPSQCVGDLFAGAINIFDGYRISGKSLQCSDPFVSEDELPIMMQKQVTINKHRWAHAIPSPEPGSVLISNTMFHQTVVLVISHCDVKGSTGIVINRYVNHRLKIVN